MKTNVVASFVGGGLLLGLIMSIGIAFTLEGSILPVSSGTLPAPSGNRQACVLGVENVFVAVETYLQLSVQPLGRETRIVVGQPETYVRGMLARRLITGRYIQHWPVSDRGFSVSLSPTSSNSVVLYTPSTSPVGVIVTKSNLASVCSTVAV